MKQAPILEMKHITKEFPGVKALDDVNMEVQAGTIFSICGENGAGKSTLMKVLSGVYPYGSYEGEIIFDGKKCKFANVKDSERKGIAIIHQELALIPELSVNENIFLGNEIVKNGLIDWSAQREKTTELLKRVGVDTSPDTQIKHLGVGKQQLVEIAKALSKDVKLLILDEPTSALNENDSANLLKLMREFKKEGITCIMISHKLNEIAEISDEVIVIRDGQTVKTFSVDNGQIDEDLIIQAMVGRPLTNRYPEHESNPGEVIFEVKDWLVEDPNNPGRYLCKNSCFNVRAGEIVGFAGLMGSGRTELMRSLFGRNYGIFRSGKLFIHGKEEVLSSVESAIKHQIAYVSEDRKNLGVNLLDSIKKTVVAANLEGIKSGPLLDLTKETIVANKYRETVGIKAASVDYGITTLSGGNQQKVVLSKWMFTDPDILILDEPTRGIDVGAKYEIYKLIHQLAAQGKAVIVVSSELPELIGITDRIYTIFEGEITGSIASKDATQESLMRMMTSTAR